VDTGWVIAAERDPRRARLHIAALTRLGQVMVVSPVVIVEARQRAGDLGRVDVVLARLEQTASHLKMVAGPATCCARRAGRAAILTGASTRSAWPMRWWRPWRNGWAASCTRAIRRISDGCATPALGSLSFAFRSDPRAVA